jgi:SAM-dependent methyltransferase
MSYANITFSDRNPVKRWLQQRRLNDAIQLTAHFQDISTVLDFGAGNGELSKRLIGFFPQVQIICYEPAVHLMAEAKINAGNFQQINFVTDIESVSKESVDLIYCLEVFEHLPKIETEAALSLICSVLREGGIAIIGVPIEIHFPALYKGIFRMTRRFGDFDATPGNILKATFGFPPQNRPVSEIAVNWLYHHHHLGFDYRRFRELIKSKPFMILKQSASPIPILGAWFNPEVYFVVRKINIS